MSFVECVDQYQTLTTNCSYSGGFCDPHSGSCVCYYAWAGPECASSVVLETDVRWMAIRWTSVAVFSGLLLWCLVLAALLIWRVWTPRLKTALNINVHILLCCFSTSLMQILYTTIDPYGWNGVINTCYLWAFYYIAYACSCCAYTLCLLRWIMISKKLILLQLSNVASSLRKFVFAVSIFSICAYFLMLFLVAPGAALACFCDGVICTLELSDQLFLSFWIFFMGVSVILSLVLISYVQYIAGTIDMRQTKFRKISAFQLLDSLCALTALGYIIYYLGFFVWTDDRSFLVVEGLSYFVLAAQILSSLLFLTFTFAAENYGEGSSRILSSSRPSLETLVSKNNNTSNNALSHGSDRIPDSRKDSDKNRSMPSAAFIVNDFKDTLIDV